MPSKDPASGPERASWERPQADREGAYLRPGSEEPIPGNAVELFPDGAEVLSRMLDSIGGAGRSISVAMYRFADDGIGCRFARALAASAQRGVRIRVLVDAAGCCHSPRTFFGWMRAHGIDVRGVNPLRTLFRGGLRSFGWREHRKLVVIDDDSAFVGGVNLSKEVAERDQGGFGWHDAAVRLRGPVVAGLAGSFDRSWREELPNGELSGRPRDLPAPAGRISALILESQGPGRGPFEGALRAAVRQARRTVWIATPYFLPPRSLRRALVGAARRGVDVRILVPGRSDWPPALWASQRRYAGFLRSGIRLFEWTAAMMHAKAAVIDGLWSTIGSYNMDPLSLLRNRELNVALLGREAGDAFERMFRRDFGRSRELSVGAWGLRSALRRGTERLCAGFRALF